MLLITSDVYNESEVFPNSNLMVPNLKYCHKVDHIQVKQKKRKSCHIRNNSRHSRNSRQSRLQYLFCILVN